MPNSIMDFLSLVGQTALTSSSATWGGVGVEGEGWGWDEGEGGGAGGGGVRGV